MADTHTTSPHQRADHGGWDTLGARLACALADFTWVCADTGTTGTPLRLAAHGRDRGRDPPRSHQRPQQAAVHAARRHPHHRPSRWRVRPQRDADRHRPQWGWDEDGERTPALDRLIREIGYVIFQSVDLLECQVHFTSKPAN